MKQQELKIYILLVISLLISFSHKILDNYHYAVDLFIFRSLTIDIQWYFKTVCDLSVNVILYYSIYKLSQGVLRRFAKILYISSYLYFPLYFMFNLECNWFFYSVILVIVPIDLVINLKIFEK